MASSAANASPAWAPPTAARRDPRRPAVATEQRHGVAPPSALNGPVSASCCVERIAAEAAPPAAASASGVRRPLRRLPSPGARSVAKARSSRAKCIDLGGYRRGGRSRFGRAATRSVVRRNRRSDLGRCVERTDGPCTASALQASATGAPGTGRRASSSCRTRAMSICGSNGFTSTPAHPASRARA